MTRLVALVVLVGALAACTSDPAPPAPSTIVSTETITRTRPAPTAEPVDTGPTKSATASSCPLLGQQAAADKVGMRLERITVQRSDGKTVGCRFYALQNSPLHDSEHLPGPNQPAIEITSVRYPDDTAAHNAFVRLAQATGTNLQQADIGVDNVGLCYQTDFFPRDKGTDWACTFSLGAVQVVVKTVVTSPALNARLVARAVAKGF